MNHSGDAAEQIVRMSLEGVEVAAKITGSAAKEIALLLMAAMKSPEKGAGSNLKLKGKARMADMLKSGKALEIFSVKESDLQKFYQGAKQYGIVYCALKNRKSSPDGLCDIMVKAEDAPKINRIVERFKFATIDRAKIENEILATKAEKSADAQPEAPDINDTEKLLDDLLGSEDLQNPKTAETEIPHPSEPTSKSKSKSERGTFEKPSVREEINKIKAVRKEKEADLPKVDERTAADKPKDKRAATHKQPNGGKRSKVKKIKSKER